MPFNMVQSLDLTEDTSRAGEHHFQQAAQVDEGRNWKKGQCTTLLSLGRIDGMRQQVNMALYGSISTAGCACERMMQTANHR